MQSPLLLWKLGPNEAIGQITFVTKTIVIKEVFAPLYDNFTNHCLWCLANKLLDHCIDLLTTMFVVTNLDRMAMVTKMNASPLICVISITVEDPSITRRHINRVCTFKYLQRFSIMDGITKLKAPTIGLTYEETCFQIKPTTLTRFSFSKYPR